MDSHRQQFQESVIITTGKTCHNHKGHIITKSKKDVFTTKDGKDFYNLEEAKRHDMQILIDSDPLNVDGPMVDFIFKHSEALVDILTTGPKSRTKTRADKGTKRKPRAAKEQPAEGAKV